MPLLLNPAHNLGPKVQVRPLPCKAPNVLQADTDLSFTPNPSLATAPGSVKEGTHAVRWSHRGKSVGYTEQRHLHFLRGEAGSGDPESSTNQTVFAVEPLYNLLKECRGKRSLVEHPAQCSQVDIPRVW